jgi:hypothetical protein
MFLAEGGPTGNEKAKLSLAFTSLPVEWRWQQRSCRSVDKGLLSEIITVKEPPCITVQPEGSKVLFLALESRVSLVFEGWSLYSAHRWFGGAMGVVLTEEKNCIPLQNRIQKISKEFPSIHILVEV